VTRIEPIAAVRRRRSGSRDLPPERRLVEVVDEGTLAVDLHHRQPLAVARLERGVAGDVDLVVGERQLDAQPRQLLARALAQVAAPRAVEDDAFQPATGRARA
jgi:hypothetical protein